MIKEGPAIFGSAYCTLCTLLDKLVKVRSPDLYFLKRNHAYFHVNYATKIESVTPRSNNMKNEFILALGTGLLHNLVGYILRSDGYNFCGIAHVKIGTASEAADLTTAI